MVKLLFFVSYLAMDLLKSMPEMRPPRDNGRFDESTNRLDLLSSRFVTSFEISRESIVGKAFAERGVGIIHG